jgi:hypothetical protein
MTSDGKSSLCLWQGELIKTTHLGFFNFIFFVLAYRYSPFDQLKTGLKK